MKQVLMAALATATLGGCATLTRGTTNDIQITSEPSSATVKTSIAHNCVTPCTLKIGRKEEFQVIFNKEGYKETIIPVKTQIANAGVAGVAGNVIVGGVVGIGVDAYTGSALEHVPNPVHAILSPIAPEPQPVAPGKKGKKGQPPAKATPVQPVAKEAPGEPET